MNITHICLTGPFTDGWSYQENLLAKYHRLMGYNVSVLTSHWIWSNDGQIIETDQSYYIDQEGISVYRLKMKGINYYYKKFKRYEVFYDTLTKTNPSIVFVHGCQFLDIKEIARYADKNPKVRIFIDNHVDFSNSASNWLSKNILHKLIWKRYAQMINPYVEKFYGVLPARVDFLADMYGIPKEKIDLLVMGADDEKVLTTEQSNAKNVIREKNHIGKDDFLIVTGGKIDFAKKQTLLLMKAIKKINEKSIKLLVFGSVTDELKEEFNMLCDENQIQYVGWINSNQSYEYFSAANLAIFPGRHSVFWEQAAGQGIPLVVKYWAGTTHINHGGNAHFLYRDDVNEISEKILAIYEDKNLYNKIKKNATGEAKKYFSYREIAKKSIK